MRRRGRGQEQQTTEKSFVLPPTFKQALKEQKMRMEERKRMQNYRSFEGERERERERANGKFDSGYEGETFEATSENYVDAAALTRSPSAAAAVSCNLMEQKVFSAPPN